MPRKTARTIAFAATGIVMLIGAGKFIEPVGRPFTIVFSAVAVRVHATGVAVRRGWDEVFDRHGTTADLEREIERLTMENAKLKTLEADNAALKTALGYAEQGGIRGTVARVLSESAEQDGERAIILDKGMRDGIVPGQPVVSASGVVIGKITRAKNHAATCLLLTDSRSRLAVAVQNGDETVGVLQGDRGLAMEVTFIPQSTTISKGDTVITSGIEPAVRRGLVVGTVQSVHKNSQDPFQTATVDPLPSARYPIFVTVLDESANGEATAPVDRH